jgi:hypothetical protein
MSSCRHTNCRRVWRALATAASRSRRERCGRLARFLGRRALWCGASIRGQPSCAEAEVRGGPARAEGGGRTTRIQLDQAQAPTMANRTGAPGDRPGRRSLEDLTAPVPGAALRPERRRGSARAGQAPPSLARPPSNDRHRVRALELAAAMPPNFGAGVACDGNHSRSGAGRITPASGAQGRRTALVSLRDTLRADSRDRGSPAAVPLPHAKTMPAGLCLPSRADGCVPRTSAPAVGALRMAPRPPQNVSRVIVATPPARWPAGGHPAQGPHGRSQLRALASNGARSASTRAALGSLSRDRLSRRPG